MINLTAPAFTAFPKDAQLWEFHILCSFLHSRAGATGTKACKTLTQRDVPAVRTRTQHVVPTEKHLSSGARWAARKPLDEIMVP